MHCSSSSSCPLTDGYLIVEGDIGHLGAGLMQQQLQPWRRHTSRGSVVLSAGFSVDEDCEVP